MEVNIEKDESIDDLQLNGLQLIQKNEGFRFGVDAVLLSHFANVKKKHRVIDLCTGTGIVSFLMYGKYNPSEVVGLEIQEEMVEMANRSAKLNDITDRIEFVKGDLKDKKLLDSLGRFDVASINDYDGLILGCPAMGAEVLEECEFQPVFDEMINSLNGKSVALFGSYGWGSGEWMTTWEEQVKEAGADLFENGLIINETPDEDGLNTG